jgi:hypothetical protein
MAQGSGRSRRLPAIPVAIVSALLLFNLGWVAHEGGPALLLVLVPVLGLLGAIRIALRGVSGSLLFWTILCLVGAGVTMSMMFVIGMSGGAIQR